MSNKQFGYLKYQNKTHATGDDFDDILESALKTYQENYHMKPSCVVDDATISKLITPRCGVPDIVNGINYMQPRGKKHNIHTVSHYSFFKGNPKWPSTKTHLTYRFLSNVPTYAIAPVAGAFQKWESSTHFTFARVQTNQNSDLEIGFFRGDHGDGIQNAFDEKSIAHASAPPGGRFHYDADDKWSVEPAADAFHLETVALHEIGHLLGFGHSLINAAIMYSTFSHGEVKILNADDIAGIRALYNR
ncbi:metalloendoproteinase 3-MMP-like [Salvia splendens]|uniref:metalloendoproteinase 3-MMP-like n=1 Tax=Salvia splendens TaxID=180675 RepID=UPI001C25A852|nr:metalloendoproteinase 3-MMP-like [Salvia splendens]